MPEGTNDTTKQTGEPITYEQAQTIHVELREVTTSPTSDVRTVSTTLGRESISLRYAPREAKPETPNTSSS